MSLCCFGTAGQNNSLVNYAYVVTFFPPNKSPNSKTVA